jgi:hypothetical protein
MEHAEMKYQIPHGMPERLQVRLIELRCQPLPFWADISNENIDAEAERLARLASARHGGIEMSVWPF